MSKLRHLWWLGLFPLLLTFFIYPLRTDGPINPHDEGIWLSLAQGLLEGKKIYKDIWLQFGPLLTAPLQALCAFDKPTVASVRATVWLHNLIGLLCIYACLLRFLRHPIIRHTSAVFLWLVPLAAFSLAIPYSARYGGGFLSLFFWPQPRDSKFQKTFYPLLAGLASGVSLLTSQEVGAASLISGIVIFSVQRADRRDLLKFFGGFLSVFIPSLLVITTQYGLTNYWRCTYIETAGLLASLSLKIPFFNFNYWKEASIGKILWLIPFQNLADVLAIYLPLATYVLILSTSLIPRFRMKAPLVLGLALYGILCSVSAWGRSDRWHFFFALSPAIFIWSYLTDQSLTRHKHKAHLAMLAFLVTGGLVTIPAHLARHIKNRFERMIQRPLNIERAGGIRVPFFQANGYEFLVDWIEKATKPGEPILFLPYDGAIYFLANRPFPGRYPTVTEAAQSYQQDEIIGDLEKAPLTWIIWDHENSHFDGIPTEKYLQRIHQYVQTAFEPAGQTGPFLFLKRRRQNPPMVWTPKEGPKKGPSQDRAS
ncbi:MAG: hypothetical protein LHV69_02430 [Elusimicrobia bacterium]|nr:hypothetical protein [Candidatus Obscuribacterium magneticum]MCB4755880.1 hypothetical protein [Candidatus Obscuribacterium magneticum]